LLFGAIVPEDQWRNLFEEDIEQNNELQIE
jgi:hypothetical protein